VAGVGGTTTGRAITGVGSGGVTRRGSRDGRQGAGGGMADCMLPRGPAMLHGTPLRADPQRFAGFAAHSAAELGVRVFRCGSRLGVGWGFKGRQPNAGVKG